MKKNKLRIAIDMDGVPAYAPSSKSLRQQKIKTDPYFRSKPNSN